MKVRTFIKTAVTVVLCGFGFSSGAADVGDTISEAMPEVRQVQNQDEFKPHVGVLGGVSNPEGSFSTGAEYAIEAGMQPIIPFGLALEINQALYDSDGASDDFKRTSFLIKGSYNFGGDVVVLKNSYVGLATGLLVEDAGPSTTTYGGLMPNIGFDIPTFKIDQEWVTLGANARYMLTASDAPDVFALNGVVKYWF